MNIFEEFVQAVLDDDESVTHKADDMDSLYSESSKQAQQGIDSILTILCGFSYTTLLAMNKNKQDE